MDVETLAVAEVNGLVAMCPHLIPLISSNDKTPFTDGHIDVYRGLTRSKEEWEGRVTVQVKGKTTGRAGKPPKSYPIPRTDLDAYKSDSGLLYLVVSIDPSSGDKQTYYALLSPFGIERILARASPKTKRISVPLKVFPSAPEEIERLVWVALKTREQRPSMGDVSSQFPKMQSLTLYSARDMSFDEPVSLIPNESDYALVLNTSDGLSLPLGGELRIFPPSYMPRTVDMAVSCGGIAYEEVVVRQIGDKTLELKLSAGLTLQLNLTPGVLSIQAAFTLSDSFIERWKVLEFHEALREGHPLVIGEQSSEILISDDSDVNQRGHLDYLRKLGALFKKLEIDPHLIKWDEIDATHHKRLQDLHRCMVEGDEFEDDSAEISLVLQQVGRWAILLLLLPGATQGYWRYVNPFAPDERSQFRVGQRERGREDLEYVPATIYDLVEQEHLPAVLNLRLRGIVEAYEVISDLPDTSTIANLKVLALISAADTEGSRRMEFLDAANALNEWLLAGEPASAHHLVNKWQIRWRLGTLTPTDREEIRALRRRVTQTVEPDTDRIAFACALLLGESEEADYLFAQLSTMEQAQLRDWPLWAIRSLPDPTRMEMKSGSETDDMKDVASIAETLLANESRHVTQVREDPGA